MKDEWVVKAKLVLPSRLEQRPKARPTNITEPSKAVEGERIIPESLGIFLFFYAGIRSMDSDYLRANP